MILAQNWLKTAKSTWQCPFNWNFQKDGWGRGSWTNPFLGGGMNIFWNYTLHWDRFNINLRQFLGRFFTLFIFLTFHQVPNIILKAKILWSALLACDWISSFGWSSSPISSPYNTFTCSVISACCCYKKKYKYERINYMYLCMWQ